jgi:sulfotransferase
MIYFLSGLPRSGSTLLGSILNQNPEVYVSPTSPLLDLLCFQNEALNKVKAQYTFQDIQAEAIYKTMPKAYYQHITKPHIIDKHRAWARNIHPAKIHISADPKVICTYRPIAEVVTSFIKLVEKDPDNFIDNALMQKRIPINNQTRAKELWDGYINDPWESLQIGLKNFKNHLLFVAYDDIINKPQDTLNNIYDFLQLNQYTHTFDGINNTCAESKDQAWGLKDLHVIRSKLEKTSNDPMEVIGKELCRYFSEFDLKL